MLPDGKKIGRFTGSLEEVQPFISPLYGAVLVRGEGMEGFILADRGKYTGVYFKDNSTEYIEDPALQQMKAIPALDFELRSYKSDEMEAALKEWREFSLRVAAASSPPRRKTISAETLEIVQKQEGVIAVAAFEDGFTVLSTGSADFEQVGAIAEDLFRAGVAISTDLGIAPLEQMILETPKAKLIIAPFGDLNLCVMTEPKTNLGLIRIAIRRLQSEVK